MRHSSLEAKNGTLRLVPRPPPAETGTPDAADAWVVLRARRVTADFCRFCPGEGRNRPPEGEKTHCRGSPEERLRSARSLPTRRRNRLKPAALRAAVPGGRRSKPSPRFCALGDVWFAALRAACRPEVYTLRTSFSGPSGVRGTEGPYFTNLLADPPGATNRRHVFRTPTPDCASTDLGRDGTHGRRAAPSSSQYRPQRTSRRLTSLGGPSLGRTTAP